MKHVQRFFLPSRSYIPTKELYTWIQARGKGVDVRLKLGDDELACIHFTAQSEWLCGFTSERERERERIQHSLNLSHSIFHAYKKRQNSGLGNPDCAG